MAKRTASKSLKKKPPPKKPKPIYLAVSNPDGSESVVELSELMSRHYQKPGLIAELFYGYPKEKTWPTLAEMATAIAKDARDYIHEKKIVWSDLEFAEAETARNEDHINQHMATMQNLPKILGAPFSVPLVWKEQPLPDSKLKLLNEEGLLEGYRDADGLIRYRSYMGFRAMAALKAIDASKRLLQALQDNDASAAAEAAMTMMLSACRYGLADELRVGHIWREGQAKGGRKNKYRHKEIFAERDATIMLRFEELLASGRNRATSVNILASRHGLSRRQINRIVSSAKKRDV